jgi:hypothetical protein
MLATRMAREIGTATRGSNDDNVDAIECPKTRLPTLGFVFGIVYIILFRLFVLVSFLAFLENVYFHTFLFLC